MKLLTKLNLVHGVIIYTYQLDDLALARASVQIVFSSVKRRSIQKLQHPPPPPPSPKTPRAFVQIPVSRGQNYVQTPYSSAGFDGKFFFTKDKISGCDSLVDLSLNSSILKDKTRVFHRRDLTTPLRKGSSSPPFRKNDSQMPECCLGGGGDVKASI